MLCYMLLVLASYVTLTRSYVGTTIFYKRNLDCECWTPNDLAKLRARKIFEELMPPNVTPDKINRKYIRELLRYFREVMAVVDVQDVHKTGILKEALADTIGGHLKSKLLPTIRFAYYSGYVPFKSAKQAHNLFEEIKNSLNTQGLGWATPDKVPQWANISVVKILVGSGRIFDPCAFLISKRDANACIHFPLPKYDNYDKPSAIALPFNFGGLVNLQATNSENILLKYYVTASRCILRRSPEKCRHLDFVNLNNELWHWMKRDVAPHLVDDKLYSAFGGIFRIAAAVQSYGKGLSRRNLFEYTEYFNRSMRWPSWEALSRSSVYITTDWTSHIYICLVFAVAILICLLQVCFSHFFRGICLCSKKKKKGDVGVAYANIESHIPAILPAHHEKLFYCFDKKQKRTPSKSQSSSVGSIKTQKVYDLNENTEKLMVIVSGNEDTESHTSRPISEDDEELTKRSKSPPKLETPIAQLRLDTSPRRYEIPFSTSTVTQSDFICNPRSESVWTGSASSSSGQSVSSSSSKSRRLRSDRDLAWARRVLSKHATHTTKSTADDSLDYHSFMMAAQRKQR